MIHQPPQQVNKFVRRRRSSVISRSAYILLLVPIFVGCSARTDREPLARFLQALEDTNRLDFDKELREFPAEERGYRYNAFVARAQVKVIDDFLAAASDLTPSGKEAVEAVRAPCVARAELCEGVVREGRSKFNEAERDRVNELLDEFLQRLSRIGRMIDGKE
jgi:hypothetical protein